LRLKVAVALLLVSRAAFADCDGVEPPRPRVSVTVGDPLRPTILPATTAEIERRASASAQAVPEHRDVLGAERVVALTDRILFKVKTSDHRAAVTGLRQRASPSRQQVGQLRGRLWALRLH
jgi:hypothetical protein